MYHAAVTQMSAILHHVTYTTTTPWQVSTRRTHAQYAGITLTTRVRVRPLFILPAKTSSSYSTNIHGGTTYKFQGLTPIKFRAQRGGASRTPPKEQMGPFGQSWTTAALTPFVPRDVSINIDVKISKFLFLGFRPPFWCLLHGGTKGLNYGSKVHDWPNGSIYYWWVFHNKVKKPRKV